MASLFKPRIVRYFDANGNRVSKTTAGAVRKTVKAAKWYGRFRKPDGTLVRVPLARDKTAAQAKLNALIRKAERADAGLPDFDDNLKQPIGRHLEDYRRHLASKNSTREYVDTTMARIAAALAGCSVRTLADLDAGNVAAWLADCRRGMDDAPPAPAPNGTAKSYAEIAAAFGVSQHVVKYWRQRGAPIRPRTENDLAAIAAWKRKREQERQAGIGATTSNHYAQALRSFGRWLARTRRLDHNPFDNLDSIDTEADLRRLRRTLPADDFARLIDATRNSRRVFRRLTGEDRAMLYTTAAYTGLRANELATMTPRRVRFDGDPPLLIVKAAYSKRRREDQQPMRPDLAAELRAWLAGRDRPALKINAKPLDEPLWPGSWHDNAAEMLRHDLAAAGIAYQDDDGHVFDFHSLRHQFISNLAAAGVHPKTAQQLARHSTIQLTMDCYTHLAVRDAAADLDKLPALPTAADRHEAQATGTDGRAAQAEISAANRVHLDSERNQKTRPAENGCAMVALPVPKQGYFVTSRGTEAERPANAKPSKNPGKHKVFPGKSRVDRAGVEPATPGFSVQCSTN